MFKDIQDIRDFRDFKVLLVEDFKDTPVILDSKDLLDNKDLLDLRVTDLKAHVVIHFVWN